MPLCNLYNLHRFWYTCRPSHSLLVYYFSNSFFRFPCVKKKKKLSYIYFCRSFSCMFLIFIFWFYFDVKRLVRTPYTLWRFPLYLSVVTISHYDTFPFIHFLYSDLNVCVILFVFAWLINFSYLLTILHQTASSQFASLSTLYSLA